MIVNSKCFDNYIMVAPGSDYGIAMWSDIKEVENATFLNYVIDTSNGFLRLMHHIHFSFGINSKVTLPFQSAWRKRYSLEKCGIEPDRRTCIIFTDISACRTDVKYLAYLHGLENVTLVLVLVNVMSKKPKLMNKRLAYFDQVYSFDRKDCETYGFRYYPTFYSKTADTETADEITSDAFFVGVSKGNRHDVLKKIFTRIAGKSGKPEFFITGVKEKKEFLNGIHYNGWLSYKDILTRVLQTNCVVEIMGSDQAGLTLRAMEAVVCNKKLLTNNESVKSLPFYQTGYIQYFSNPDEIDVDFILKKENVDYHYAGEFSPIHLLEKIDEIKSSETEDVK